MYCRKIMAHIWNRNIYAPLKFVNISPREVMLQKYQLN